MRHLGLFFLLITIISLFVTNGLLYFQMRKYLRKKWLRWTFWSIPIISTFGLIVYQLVVRTVEGPALYYWICVGTSAFVIIFTPLLLLLISNALTWPVYHFLKRDKAKRLKGTLTLSALCFLYLWYAMTLGTSAYKVQQTDIAFQNLPRAFDDFKIVQISDLHLGSLSPQSGNIAKLVGEINALQPDAILFTGDMINSFAAELLPWIAELRKLYAPYGKFAVRGNHDYGDYHRWKTPEDRNRNLANFKQNMQDAGFTLLDNANVPLVKGNDTIYIAGEENWGKPPFQQYGNLEETIAGTENHFLVLMSHDPSHWRAEILAHNIPLTLSGHTHAMQVGIIIGSYKWSPARYLYPEYEGLYERDGKYIFVSSGAGFLGIGGRIGFRPHIEDIHLKSSLR